MQLRERFRRLTFWNKIGVVGGVASILGILLAVLLFWLSTADTATLARKADLNALGQPPDYESLNRPYLDASLVVHSLSQDSVGYHFEITNLGKLPAEDIRFVFHTPSSAGSQTGGEHPPGLAPGATMSLDDYTFRADIPNADVDLSMVFACDYSARVAGSTNCYHCTFPFTIYARDIRLGVYRQNGATLAHGPLSESDKSDIIQYKSWLNEPTGGTSFWFDLRGFTRQLPVVFFHGRWRTLLYEPFTSNVIFRATLPTGETKLMARRLARPGKHWHFVFAQARTNEAMLMVDGEMTQ